MVVDAHDGVGRVRGREGLGGSLESLVVHLGVRGVGVCGRCEGGEGCVRGWEEG